MIVVEFKPPEKGRIKKRAVETPWMTPDEAAAYCRVARSTFDSAAADQLPHGVINGHRRYHVNILDAWIDGRLVTAPQPDQQSGPPGPCRRRRQPEELVLMDPVSGKVRAERRLG